MEQDKIAIKSMCGCYDVGFNFIETFQYSDDTTYIPSKEKHVGALEWAGLVEDSDGKISIQHLLVVGPEDSPMIIKHWRQDWIFENTEFYMYNGDNEWLYEKKTADQVKGQWTQKVYQVDDSPRYEGAATWIHADGKSYWENTTDAPLPRREYTQRSDYNVTERTNRHEITATGWIHDQDNKKILREKGQDDVVIAEEKGYNTYMKVDDSKCQAAMAWWKENGEFWANVRASWDEVYDSDQTLHLEEKVEGKRIYEVLFEMDLDTKQKKVSKLLQSYVN